MPKDTTSKQFPILRREKHDISLKILHQAGFESARQAATLTKVRALTIAPCPSLSNVLLNPMEVVATIKLKFNCLIIMLIFSGSVMIVVGLITKLTFQIKQRILLNAISLICNKKFAFIFKYVHRQFIRV